MTFEQEQKSEVSGIADEEILAAVYDGGLPPEELADYMAWNSYGYGEGQSRSQDAGRIACGSGSAAAASCAGTPARAGGPLLDRGDRADGPGMC